MISYRYHSSKDPSVIRETQYRALPGVWTFIILFLASLGASWALGIAINQQAVWRILLWSLAAITLFILWFGFFIVQPNKGKVLQLFGDYAGTARVAGLWWANPFFTKRPLSTRVRNFETTKLKVNDRTSNPVEIAAVVVWQVVDTAEAMFEVDNFEDYVHVQSESALRGLANQYPYDAHEDGTMSLSSHTQEIAEKLKGEIQERLAKAGVSVLEARISHLAYAPEIASVMLRRQQAAAVIAARRQIVDGAVGMVEQALDALAKRSIVTLDEERKAAMVSNLLVVLCAEQPTTPVVNTGSLY